MAAEVNVAEGRKQARILASEAEKQELINAADGSAALHRVVSGDQPVGCLRAGYRTGGILPRLCLRV